MLKLKFSTTNAIWSGFYYTCAIIMAYVGLKAYNKQCLQVRIGIDTYVCACVYPY